MPQVSTSSEAGLGTRIIYCFIIHICLRWNIYMRMDNSLVHFIRVAGGTFRRWIYPDNPPPPPLGYSNDRDILPACLSLAGEPDTDWAISGGGTGEIFFLHFNLLSISFAYWQNINKKRLTFKKTNPSKNVRQIFRNNFNNLEDLSGGLHIICICAAYSLPSLLDQWIWKYIKLWYG